jgi:mono/diheme cytochrome c family protein
VNTNLMVMCGVLLVGLSASAQKSSETSKPAGKATSQVSTAVAMGKKTYLEYCAVCHGPDGRGTGPAASSLKKTPADLTTLSKTHDGKFPEEYVSGILKFGKPISAHGSADMPVWGPVFGRRENGNQAAVSRRIKNLCEYLATIQEKES